MIYSDNTYDITNNITTYTRRDFKSVFDITSNKWYMLNNLNNYEEYGIYGDSFDTYYQGKLVIVNDREYEWDGAEWDDLGEYIQRIGGWTNDTASNFSIKYNGSNYVLKATQNDIEFTIFCLQNVPSSQYINFISSASQGDRYEYELFYTGGEIYFDLGYLSRHRIEATYTWLANTEYTIQASNGNYFYTSNPTMKLYINNGYISGIARSTYDNTSDRITMGYLSAYKYNKECKIYESTGLKFDIKCKEDNGQYVLYDALGNGELYNYGTEDPVVVSPIMTSQRPKDYDTKSVPTISTLWTSTIYRNSAHLTTLMRNDAEIAKIDYMSDDILKKGEAPILIDYLCFEANTSGSTIALSNTNISPNIEYSRDKNTWTTWNYSALTLQNVGDKIYMRGSNPNGIGLTETNVSKFIMTGSISASGNIMTLIDKVGETLIIPSNYCFRNLFRGCTSLVEANISLPATTLTNYCYDNMFRDCTNLSKAPVLVATNANYTSCYRSMFNKCNALNKIITYAQTIGANSTEVWLDQVAATGDFYNLGGANYQRSASGIPTGWAIHTSL